MLFIINKLEISKQKQTKRLKLKPIQYIDENKKLINKVHLGT